MRTTVIFNPAARGEKAQRFRQHLSDFGAHCVLKLTAGPGDARRLAAEAVQEGYECIVAAGGDGTVNEVLNGVGDTPGGFKRACLGVLPLGTINVFARELLIPNKLELAWEIILAAKTTSIDLPKIEFRQNGQAKSRWFAQLAGAGLDARAVELVAWSLKKRIGPLAYVYSGLKALLQPSPSIRVTAGLKSYEAQLVLVGNGKLYGGQFKVFPNADLRDGLLEVCLFPRVNWLTLARCSGPLLLKGLVPASAAQVIQAEKIELSSTMPVPVQIDGELIGHLPAIFSIERHGLRVVVPSK